MSALDTIKRKELKERTQLDWCVLVVNENGGEATAECGALELLEIRLTNTLLLQENAELRRLVALLTTEPLHITRADIDAAKRILQKAEES